MSHRTLIVGVGSDFGDDQAGLIAAQQLAGKLTTTMVRQLCSPASLLDLLGDLDELHIIDACRGNGEVGAVMRCPWPSPTLAEVRFVGTHDFDLVTALRLAQELCLLPPSVTIWAIEAGSIRQPIGASLSVKVATAVDRIVAQLSAEFEAESQHA